MLLCLFAALQSVAFLFTGRTPQVKCLQNATGCLNDGDSIGCNWQPPYTLNSYDAEFGLVCERKYLASLLTTGYFAGYALGAFSSGQLADYYGRKPTSLWTLLLTFAFQIGSSFVPTYEWMFVTRFGLGVAFGGVTNVTFTWFIEFFTPSHRNVVVSVLFVTYAFFCALNPALGMVE
jgi:MFS family permease